MINQQTGDNFGESTYRKWYSAYSEGYEDATKENIDDNGLLKKLDDKIDEAYKMQVKFQDQRREYRKLLRDVARNEYNREFIEKVAKDIAKVKPLKWSQPETMVSNREAILLCSDWHYGLFASNYWNDFDKEEFKRRIKVLVQKTLQYGKFESQANVLHMFLLADLIHGLIHTTARIASVENVVEQTMYVSEVLAEIICEFASNFEEVFIYHVTGNHERVTPNKNESISKENFSLFIPWWLETRLNQIDNVHFMEHCNVDEEIVVTDILDYKIIGTHGHREGNNLENGAKNLGFMCKVIPDYIFLGHTHHSQEDESHGCEIIVNPCLSGVDDHAKNIRKTNNPSQKLLIFEQDKGRINTYNIKF